MQDYSWILVVIAIILVWWIISWIRETISNSKKYLKLKPALDALDIARNEHGLKVKKDKLEFELNMKRRADELELKEKRRADDYSVLVKKTNEEWDVREKQLDEKTKRERTEIDKVAKQKSMGFPWLAEAYADYFALKDGELEEYLKSKKHPAYTAAENVKIIKNEKRELVRTNKIIRYKINYFEKLFPWLVDLVAIDESDEIPVRIDDDTVINEDGRDRVEDFLTQEEYRSLPSAERNQRALDRYLKNRNKSKWAIGRDYEMYVGYLYEQKGYAVEYKGIIDGFEDLGRDIIAIKDDEVCIAQCKYWAQYKEIHEKHIFQLFGTAMEYWIKNYRTMAKWNLFVQNLNNDKNSKSFEEFSKFLNENKLRPIFYSSTGLSNKAKEMAAALSVEIIENYPIGDFPRIKCNINKDEFGIETKIYHLPMDQQYDRTLITKSKGEFYAFTVKEAEDAGFRRAFKHRFAS